MKRNPDAVLNVLGKTVYLDDIAEPAGTLHCALVASPSARGTFVTLDTADALAMHPSVRIFTAADIPGENQLGTAVMDEPLLAEGSWEYRGQVVALAVACTRRLARKAASLVRITGIEELKPVLDPREAFRNGDIILSSRTQRTGDTEAAFAGCAVVVAGRADSGGQEHLYLETQGCLAFPEDSGGVRLVSGTQSPSGVQKIVSRILALPMHLIEVETRRLGGAFGGKEDQASPWAALAALAAFHTGKPVKLYLNRRDDMFMTGKRHPYSSDFKIGLSADGMILAYEADFYQNSGAATDLSPAILPRTLFHAAGAYHIPNVRVTGTMCRTNLVPFTAFRGFGGPQGLFVIESAIYEGALALGMDPSEVQRKNLLASGDMFHYGMPVTDCLARETFDRCASKAGLHDLQAAQADFNRRNRSFKKGSAVYPLCFGISFTKEMMNQGGALVHIYTDGSVGVSTGAVEMGQGVGRKIVLIVAHSLGVPEERVRIEPTRTSSVANTMPTAASTGTDINGMAAQVACGELRERLLLLSANILGLPQETLVFKNGVLLVIEGDTFRETGKTFADVVRLAHEKRVDLSAHGFYATPGLFYDAAGEKGSPFCYHVYGCAVVTATLDVVHGTYAFDEAHIVHDTGISLDRLVDMGQVEGAFAQGLGWAALEDLKFDDTGKLVADTLSTYKVPDNAFMPELRVELFERANRLAVSNSKGVGEPPLMYGIAGYFAVLSALKAARPGKRAFYDLPMTAEKALAFLMEEDPC